ncbi:MAG: cob(I)yrinic acid a,c-diamide adenosyltransferase [Lachnospiraceae bacterium]|nr:cob(I)yrinic acid a,c-diamide adenosyltransferase [Lachnospiraceae bacterium]
MIHLYYGDGKGKTTAAMGLALRALGHGMKVVVVQFLKNGKSGELIPLVELGAKVFSGKPQTKFFREMSEAEREEARQVNNENLRKALSIPCDLLILDEACAACRLGMVDEDLLRSYVEHDAPLLLESNLEKPIALNQKEIKHSVSQDASKARHLKSDFREEPICSSYCAPMRQARMSEKPTLLDKMDGQKNFDTSEETRSAKPEIVLTGREPLDWMVASADYITEMRSIRHPYEKGVRARVGIEF